MKPWERPGTDELNPIIPMSLDEYLQSDFHPDVDYYDGAARERNRGYYPHSRTMVVVGAKLEEKGSACGHHTLMSCRMWVAPDAILVPDLCLIRRSTAREDILVTPPTLCVEIIDDQDTFYRMKRRVDMLLHMGVRHIWLIHDAVAFAYVASEIGFQQPRDGVFRLPGTPIELQLDEVLAALNEG